MSDTLRLEHILHASGSIVAYGARDRADPTVFDAIIRQLSIIGETVRVLSPLLRKKYPDVPWKKIVGLRNMVIHEYYLISNKRIWQIVDHDIPELKPTIEAIIASLEN